MTPATRGRLQALVTEMRRTADWSERRGADDPKTHTADGYDSGVASIRRYAEVLEAVLAALPSSDSRYDDVRPSGAELEGTPDTNLPPHAVLAADGHLHEHCHDLVCNGSRDYARGVTGHGCSCRGREVRRLADEGRDAVTHAVQELRAAYEAMPREGHVGWVDDFQRRDRRVRDACAALLNVALTSPLQPHQGTPK